MSVLLHISDTHFGTERAGVVDALVRLAAVERPQLLVLSGDITQRARPEQFAAARRLVERIAAPAALVLPGNHDVPLFDIAARALRPYGRYARAFGGNLAPVHESDDLLVLGVNTTRAYRHKHGEISPAQMQATAARLRASHGRKLRIVVTHHPLHVPRSADERNLARGYAHAARMWASAGADLAMGGHIHLPYVRPVAERVAGLSRPLWVVQAGTAVSHRVRADGGEANSVNLVRYDPVAAPGSCVVEQWDHDAVQDRFRMERRVSLALHRP